MLGPLNFVGSISHFILQYILPYKIIDWSEVTFINYEIQEEMISWQY